VAVPLVFELSCVGVLVPVWQESRNQTERELHDKEIVAEVNNLMRLTITVATLSLTLMEQGGQPFKDERDRDLAELERRIRILDEMAQGDPLIKSFVAKAAAHLHKINRASETINVTKDMGEVGRALYFRDLNHEIHQFSAEMTKFLETQSLQAKALHLAQASSQRTINLILLTLIFSSISLAVGLALYFNMQAARRLSKVMGSITSLAAGHYGSLPLAGEDEFALLDQDIHSMAAKLLEATRKERAVVENAVDVIFSINTKGQFTAVNPAAAGIWGYREANLLSMTITDVLAEGSRQNVIQQLREAAIRQKPCTLEAQTIAANGTNVEQLWSVSWSKTEQTLFCVAHDISERKRVEQLKQEFVAMITHDLRTPLASIKAMLELLAQPNSNLSPEWRERVKQAEESSARLISLINDLLDLEKMQAGKLVIAPDICLIDDLVESSIETLQSFAESRNISISHQKSGLVVVADERRLVQVIVNLLSNAIKFSPPGSPITIGSIAVAKLVELRITDRGRGIPQDKVRTIFDRFEQLSGLDTGARGSTGLGLAICQEIIKAHGGNIGVESQEGAGSTFWFRLPSGE